MAQRRMFSPQIVDSDAFLDMSSSAQNLYFHLGMRADDDGFVGNPKKILRMIGGNDDDLRLLFTKRFILTFDNGIIVIKHWRINNLIRKDWYRPTIYQEEKLSLKTKKNGEYVNNFNTLVNENSPTRPRRLDKVSIVKNRLENSSVLSDGILTDEKEKIPVVFSALKKSNNKVSPEIKKQQEIIINKVIPLFEILDVNWQSYFTPGPQRTSIKKLLDFCTKQKRDLSKLIQYAHDIKQFDTYAPRIVTPSDMASKFTKLVDYYDKHGELDPMVEYAKQCAQKWPLDGDKPDQAMYEFKKLYPGDETYLLSSVRHILGQ